MSHDNQIGLERLLRRRWLLFAGGLIGVMAVASLLLNFMVEDGVIDRRLRLTAQQLQQQPDLVSRLPPEFQLYTGTDLPLDIAAYSDGRTMGVTFEMRRPSGAYIHAVSFPLPDEGRATLVYDVTYAMVVVPGLWVWASALLVLTLLVGALAWVLSHRLTRQIGYRAERLVDAVRQSQTPSALRTLADAEPIAEFAAWLRLYADMWSAERQAIHNERVTLSYLAHELRTPLQSAETSLALLSEERSDSAAFDRLQRAISRLTRASSAALWLATERAPEASTPINLAEVVQALLLELAPLARMAGKTLDLSVTGTPRPVQAPTDMAECILANLLSNALRHSTGDAINIHLAEDMLTISNAADPTTQSHGFGVGLEIVQRLCGKIGWTLTLRPGTHRFEVSIRVNPAGAGGETVA